LEVLSQIGTNEKNRELFQESANFERSTSAVRPIQMNTKSETSTSTSTISSAAASIAAVKKGAQTIDESLKRDEEAAEIWDFFNQTSSGQYTIDDIAQFFIKKKILIPAALLEEYNCIQNEHLFSFIFC
jgi:hypothetical protein